jgi:hypothetical protein
MNYFLMTMWGTIIVFSLWSIEKKLITLIEILTK